jgi:orotate phosphoribosyltransferase
MVRTIQQFLEENGGILRDTHVVLTSGKHATWYINIRAVAQHTDWWKSIGQRLAYKLTLQGDKPDIIIGAVTLGQTLADHVAINIPGVLRAWCNMKDGVASFDSKLPFEHIFEGRTVSVVDDLATTSGTIAAVRDLVTAKGGKVISAAVIVRRDQTVTEIPGIPAFFWLEDIKSRGQVFSPEECLAIGPCSRNELMIGRPGHGHEFKLKNLDYPMVEGTLTAEDLLDIAEATDRAIEAAKPK